jgi:benzil reductase ((S)-benzoin forming)
MADALVWISGASGGIGSALADVAAGDGARVIDISRHGREGLEHVAADLSDPSSWLVVAEAFARELRGFGGDRVVFVHAAGTIDPIGFAGEVDAEQYNSSAILNSAAPQALGNAFLAAAKDVDARRELIMLTSGAASSVYPGWSAYGAGKAAIDQWVRDVGAEQGRRGGVQVIAVAPGTVDTAMQAQIRATPADDFPQRDKFVGLHERGELADPNEVARTIWTLPGRGLDNGAVVDLRELASSGER